MRIAVCGKGGSGKSTISALLAKEMAKTKNVLVLDIDESNYGLHSQLGMAAPRDLMEYFGGKKGFKEKQRAAPKTTQFWGLAANGGTSGQPAQPCRECLSVQSGQPARAQAPKTRAARTTAAWDASLSELSTIRRRQPRPPPATARSLSPSPTRSSWRYHPRERTA